ncbi:erythromycin esterase-like protein [Stackebrandtia endophytica]|uniref:Erythromycin esterase-like protein n=1 Tax=Stackebrandtia endophytica TaxID=1496996 RepID=A0A543AYR9_9ACTN|nr:erythromycin esterase family protein [Stackebrandtia endophytica]TQL77722.1 erythromycin esterase-like protein [Stackebrandtia endophytica]
MNQDIRTVITASVDLLAVGEPTHQEPAFGRLRNDLFADLVDEGFRSIALETDRVAALMVDDFIQGGHENLDTVMRDGFSHGFSAIAANRELVVWMRDYNREHPDDRVTFHGFDLPAENTSAPSPRHHLEYALGYLGLDLDLTGLLGPDDRWSRSEAILDATASIGDTSEAAQLRVLADDLLTTLHARAPELIAASSRADWYRARIHLTTALGLLRYHRKAAQRIDEGARISVLLATRDALMAQNLLDIRTIEEGRGGTLVGAHNGHVQRDLAGMHVAGMELDYHCAGAIVDALLGRRYAVVIGSLGRSDSLGLADPDSDTYEGVLQRRVTGWGLIDPTTIPPARRRTDQEPQQGYSPLHQSLIGSADAVLHLADPDALA